MAQDAIILHTTAPVFFCSVRSQISYSPYFQSHIEGGLADLNFFPHGIFKVNVKILRTTVQ